MREARWGLSKKKGVCQGRSPSVCSWGSRRPLRSRLVCLIINRPCGICVGTRLAPFWPTSQMEEGPPGRIPLCPLGGLWGAGRRPFGGASMGGLRIRARANSPFRDPYSKLVGKFSCPTMCPQGLRMHFKFPHMNLQVGGEIFKLVGKFSCPTMRQGAASP